MSKQDGRVMMDREREDLLIETVPCIVPKRRDIMHSLRLDG